MIGVASVAGDIPTDVARFIQHTLPSPAHLEALVALCRESTRWWTSATLGRELHVITPIAEDVLEDLCSANLLEVQIASALAYRYKPVSPELDAQVAAVIEALRESRVQVYTLCGSRSLRAARQFADAFRLRKPHRG